MNLIEKVLEWPIILQGALGSFLFWLILTGGQKLFLFISSQLSKQKDLGHSFAKLGRESFNEGNYHVSTYSLLVAIYGAFHYFLKFVLTALIAYIFQQFIQVFGIIGYIISVYFLFRALTYVPHFNTFEKGEMKKNIKKEVKSNEPE